MNIKDLVTTIIGMNIGLATKLCAESNIGIRIYRDNNGVYYIKQCEYRTDRISVHVRDETIVGSHVG